MTNKSPRKHASQKRRSDTPRDKTDKETRKPEKGRKRAGGKISPTGGGNQVTRQTRRTVRRRTARAFSRGRVQLMRCAILRQMSVGEPATGPRAMRDSEAIQATTLRRAWDHLPRKPPRQAVKRWPLAQQPGKPCPGKRASGIPPRGRHRQPRGSGLAPQRDPSCGLLRGRRVHDGLSQGLRSLASFSLRGPPDPGGPPLNADPSSAHSPSPAAGRPS